MRPDTWTHRIAWAVVLALPAVTLALMLGLRRDPKVPNIVLRGEMVSSPAYLGQDPWPAAPDRPVMRAPAPGTLARGQASFRYRTGEEEIARAGRELTSPLPAEPVHLEAGRAVYETFCSVCHGPSGAGDGSVVPPFPNPPDLRAAKTVERPDGALFHIITLGKNKMPAHRAELTPTQRWQVIRYLRSLQVQDLEGAEDTGDPQERTGAGS